MILPGATIGILGAGQLGRMLAVPARQLGYGVVVFGPEGDAPAAGLADHWVRASFEDEEAALRMAESCEVLTYEFENVPAETVRRLAQRRPVHPGAEVLAITQDRLAEHAFVQKLGIPTAPGAPVLHPAELPALMARLGSPARLKTARGGYDGGGQWRLLRPEDAPESAFRHGPLLLEREVTFERELSVVVVRDTKGQIMPFPVFENQHREGILRCTRCPADIGPQVHARALEIARCLAEAMELVGTLTVEMFQVGSDLWVNELAPRVHNSGHLSIEACSVSQFEQHIRAICGLPLREVELRRPAAMVNLLGEEEHRRLRVAGVEDALGLPDTHLHIYGKTSVRKRRKMGHITALADSVEQAMQKAQQAAATIRFVAA